MINKVDKNESRMARHFRIRNKVSGTGECPRLSVYRSLNGIYVQLIDDTKGVTLVSASTLDKDLKPSLEGKTKVEQAKLVGNLVAERALKNNIKCIVFDRAGYLYTGRVKAVAEAARNAGLKF